MRANNYSTSACRYCRFYNPEGRRGGMCSQLNVSVKSHWKSCQFACPVFNRDWQTMPEVAMLEKSFTLGCATPSGKIKVEEITVKDEDNKLNKAEIV